MEIVFDKVKVILNRNTPLEKVVLNNVSFTLESGKKYSFVGKSNSGKTAICELINGSLLSSSGSVKIGEFINDGRKLKNANKLRFNVGLVYKNSIDMFFKRKVKDELSFGIKYFKYKIDKRTIREKDALKIVGLDEGYLEKRIDELTLSEAKLVQIAAVLVYNPKVLILDEPTVHLNYKEKKALIRILNYINEKYKKTIIIMSRDIDFVYEFNSSIFIMYNGRLMCEGENNILESEEITKYGIDLPSIVKFTKVANQCGADLKQYKDIKDLIKGVCNNVL